MTKAELMKEFEKLQEQKKVQITGIYWNSRKIEIENAIECLKCPDELLEKYLIVVSLKYPQTPGAELQKMEISSIILTAVFTCITQRGRF